VGNTFCWTETFLTDIGIYNPKSQMACRSVHINILSQIFQGEVDFEDVIKYICMQYLSIW